MTDLPRISQDQTAIGYNPDGHGNAAETIACKTTGARETFEILIIVPAASRALLRLLAAVHRKRLDQINDLTEDT